MIFMHATGPPIQQGLCVLDVGGVLLEVAALVDGPYDVRGCRLEELLVPLPGVGGGRLHTLGSRAGGSTPGRWLSARFDTSP